MLVLLIDILEAIARSPFHWLIWNRVLKIDRRLMWSPVYGRLDPTVNGRKPQDFGCDACAILSIFGWGWVFGWRVKRNARGTLCCPTPARCATDFQPHDWPLWPRSTAWMEPQTPAAYKCRVFGRINAELLKAS